MIGASIETTRELWASSLREVKKRIRPLFAQERAALNAGLFVDGLLGDERRKTGWMRAVIERRRWAPAQLGAMSSPVSFTLASLNRALCGAEGPTAGCRRCENANASGNANASSPGGFAPGLEGTDLKMRGWGREARPAKQTLS